MKDFTVLLQAVVAFHPLSINIIWVFNFCPVSRQLWARVTAASSFSSRSATARSSWSSSSEYSPEISCSREDCPLLLALAALYLCSAACNVKKKMHLID
jgi:hypothetical protein